MIGYGRYSFAFFLRYPLALSFALQIVFRANVLYVQQLAQKKIRF